MSSTGSNEQSQNTTETNNSATNAIGLCYDSDYDVLYESESSNDSDIVFDEIKPITKQQESASSNLQKQTVRESHVEEKIVSPLSSTFAQKDTYADLRNEFRNKSEEDILSNVMARLTWLSCHAISCMQGRCLTPPDPKDIYQLSCALWISQDLVCCDKVSALLTPSKFELFLQWSLTFSPSSMIKLALDRVLCSMYALKPEMFPALLEKFNIILPAVTNDRNSETAETAHCFVHIRATNIICDPYEERRLSTVGCLSMTDDQYRTLAQISLSNVTALQLIHSGYLALLIDLIIEFCDANTRLVQTANDSMDVEVNACTIEHIVRIVRFLSELCEEGSIRIWLAFDEVRMFWDALFLLLCQERVQNSNTEMASLNELSDATVLFFSKCCQCYPESLKKLSKTITTHFSAVVKRDGSDTIIESDFGRKIFTELIMATEYIYVSVEINLERPINFCCTAKETVPFLPPPNYPPSNVQQFMYLDTNCTGSDIIEKILGDSTKSEDSQHVNKRMKLERTDIKIPCLFLWDFANFKFIKVEKNLTIAQMLTILLNTGNTLENPIIKFLVTEKPEQDTKETDFYDVMPFSFLKMLTDAAFFSQICTDFVRPNAVNKLAKRPKLSWQHHPSMLPPHSHNLEEIIALHGVNVSDYTFGGFGFSELPGTSKENPEKPVQYERFRKWSAIPLLSLVIHGQCLKLFEYRQEIKNRPILHPITSKSWEMYLDIDKIKVLFVCNPEHLVNPLATLPLELLRFCFMAALHERRIREVAMKNGIIDLIFASLAIVTHHSEAVEEDYIQNRHLTLVKCLKQCKGTVIVQSEKDKKKREKKEYCWPKGIGYGTGNEYSGISNFDQNNAKKRLKAEEEYVTILLQVLASYIHPDYRLRDLYQNYMNEICDLELGGEPYLPPEFIDLLERSCLLPVLIDYLRNDSILDIVRHMSLYTAVMQLLRCMASNTQTVKFVVSNDHLSTSGSTSSDSKFTSIPELLKNMKTYADTYSIKYLTSVPSTVTGTTGAEVDEETLIVDIQITAIILNIIKQKLSSTGELNCSDKSETKPIPEVKMSDEQRYLEVMGKLRFASYDIISENSENQLTFNVEYAYSSQITENNKNAISHPTRSIRRIAQEISSLSTSLPITYSSSIFVRCDTDRLDVMKVLITGPANTPYMNGCFEFDVHFPSTYPNTPMHVQLVTTGRHKVRFNPNLYDCGKVCLSLLNTWQGQPEEKWNAQTSSLIQVLISIQALIFVPDPYFNEPGYQNSRGTKMGDDHSKKYNSKLLPQTIKWAMLEQMRCPNPCFREVINTHFWMKRDEICQQISKWITEETDCAIKAEIQEDYLKLQREFSKLRPPETMTD